MNRRRLTFLLIGLGSSLIISDAKACSGVFAETSILQRARPSLIPKGATLLLVDVNLADVKDQKSYFSGIFVKVRQGPKGLKKALVAASSWSSCTRWRDWLIESGQVKAKNPYYLVGYLYRGKTGLAGVDPIEYGNSAGRMKLPEKRFLTGPDYFLAIAKNIDYYKKHLRHQND